MPFSLELGFPLLNNCPVKLWILLEKIVVFYFVSNVPKDIVTRWAGNKGADNKATHIFQTKFHYYF